MKKGNLRCSYKVKGKNVELLPKYLHNKNINVYNFKITAENEGEICIDFLDRKKFFAICKNMCYNKHIMGYKGIFSPIAIFVSKMGIVIGACLYILISCYLDAFICKIEITGSGSYYKEQTYKVIENFGVKKYGKFSDYNLKKLETEILKSNQNLSFVSCKKRGNSLIINCVLSSSENLVKSNNSKDLVSLYDGTIESLVVFRGTPILAVGDSVKKGEVIVGGYFLGSEDKVFETQALSRATLIVNEEYFFDDVKLTEENKEIYKNVALFYSQKECVEYEITRYKNGVLVKLKLRVYLSGG